MLATTGAAEVTAAAVQPGRNEATTAGSPPGTSISSLTSAPGRIPEAPPLAVVAATTPEQR